MHAWFPPGLEKLENLENGKAFSSQGILHKILEEKNYNKKIENEKQYEHRTSTEMGHVQSVPQQAKPINHP